MALQDMVAGLGSLSGTLTPEGLLSAQEAMRQERLAELARRTQLATGQAGEAEQAYTQAAQAPPPDLAPLALLLQTLGGNVSSTLAQDPSFTQRAQGRIQQSRAQLLRQRAETIQNQRDVFQQRTEEAKRLGNLEEQEKYNAKMLLLDKQFDLVSATQKRAQAVEDREDEQRARLAEIALRNQVGPGGGTPGEASPAVVSFAGQVQRGEIEFSSVPAKFKPAVSQYMTENQMQIVPKKVRDTLLEISTGRAALRQIEQLSKTINTSTWKGRLKQGVRATAGGLAQSRPEVARFNAQRRGLLAALSRATGERGVLTNQDVDRARQLLPTVFDSQEVASKKLADFKEFFDEKERQARGSYYSTGQGTTVGQAGDPLGIR